MSHGHERKDKNCLNCGATVQGRYCQVCGQENIEPKETFWTMFTHFFNDITHFDGKFFETLKDLLFRPGFLSSEYMKGKRMSYLNPVRMYVFTSAIFFLVFFGSKTPEKLSGSSKDAPLTYSQRQKQLEILDRRLKADPNDRIDIRKRELLMDSSKMITSQILEQIEDPKNKRFALPLIGSEASTVSEYDREQTAMAANVRDGWIKRIWNKKVLKMKENYGREEASRKIIDIFLHNLPYLLFVSLPLFALILKLLYVRRRKEFYYADHGIFSIHHYIFSFILMLTTILLGKLTDLTHWAIWDLIVFLLILSWPFHMYKAMRKFYRQGRGKTFLKFLLLNFLGFVMIVLLLALFGLISVFQI